MLRPLAASGGVTPHDDNLQGNDTPDRGVTQSRQTERNEDQHRKESISATVTSKEERGQQEELTQHTDKSEQKKTEPRSTHEPESGVEQDGLESNIPVEEFSLLPGITVKTYIPGATRRKGSRFYREFRNTCRRKKHASDQGDIRKWVQETSINQEVNEMTSGSPTTEKSCTDHEKQETTTTTNIEVPCHPKALRHETAEDRKLTSKPRLKSVVFKVTNPSVPRETNLKTWLKVTDSADTRKVVRALETEKNGYSESKTLPDNNDTRKVVAKQTDLRTWLDQNDKRDSRKIHLKETNEDSRTVLEQAGPEELKTREGRSEIKTLTHNINTGPADDILSKNNNLQMRRGDYRSLTGNNYVNDKVIDEYMFLIKERNQTGNLPAVGVLSVHMFKLLDENFQTGYEKTRNWIREDLTQKDIILVPIHRLSHWSLVAVDMKEHTISYYDSILGSRRTSNAPKIIKKHMETYCREKGKDITFSIDIKDNAPLQRNGVDCGVFVCQNAEKIARQVHVNTRQEDMKKARLTMMLEIFKGRLSVEEERNVTEFVRLSGESKGKKKKEKPIKQAKKNPSKQSDTKDCKAGRSKIDWPPANSKEWARFETDVAKLLSFLDGPPSKRAIQHPKIIYEMGRERFGIKSTERMKNQPAGPSRRQKKCLELRQNINRLKKAYNDAPEEEKKAIQELQQEQLKQLRLSKRAETLRKNRKKVTRNSNNFLRQPFQFTRELINPKPKGELENCQEEVETYLEKAHSDKEKNDPLPPLDCLWEFADPVTPLKDNPPTFRELTEKLKKTRSKSAPGPNGVPYLVYKRCPDIARILYKYLRGLWIKNQISETWKEAEGVLIPKEDGATDISKFRTISLLNVEGKLYFAFKAKRLLDYTLSNGYIDTAIQKGGIPGVSGCLEHTALLSQLIQEAKTEKKNLVITWLDISNAYGSIPHKLIIKALESAHVSKEMIDLIKGYYDNPKIRFATKQFTTDWQKLEKGIITGCTLSVVLFTLTMTWLVLSAKKETKGPKTKSGQQQENSRLFMDDLNTTTETIVQTSYLLRKLEIIFNWAGLDFKQEKCRALIIIKGMVERREILLNGKPITLIQDKPAKYLGKTYNHSLTEQDQIKQFEKEVKQALKDIDNCKLPGRYKSWMIQHMLLKRIMWPLCIYNVPYSKVEEVQKQITAKLKKWLGLPKSLTVDAIYATSSKLQLPFTSLVEEVKVTKARTLISFQEAKDPCVSNADIQVDGGRKANTKSEVEDARSRLRMKDIAGIANIGREGLGLSKRQYYCKSNKRDQRTMVTEEIRKIEEEKRQVRMVGLGKQGASTRWEVPERNLSQGDLLKTSDAAFRFLVKSVYDLLPTPANKNTWFGTEEKCALCEQEGTLIHILTGCKVALAQGRYKWRHDQVLRTIASAVDDKRRSKNNSVKQVGERMIFLKEGEKPKKQDKSQKYEDSYLNSANDWKLEVDLDGRLKVPIEVTTTNLRPDMMVISRQTKQVGFIELTVPNEDRIEISGEIKKAKYEAIEVEGRQKGWRVRIWAVEVGCRGFPASSMTSFLKEIGYKGKERKRVLDEIGQTAESATHSIWKWSQMKNWGSQC